MRLMRYYLHKYHHLYEDKFSHQSTWLLTCCKQADTYLCGTTRGTWRDFPQALAGVILLQGESAKWTNADGIMLCKWRDICMIATTDSGNDTVRATRRHREIVNLSATVCVGRYNLDRLDQMRAYYGVGRAGRRWWKHLFWSILNVGLINAYVQWTIANRPLPASTRFFSLKSFKLKLIHDMCDGHIFRGQRAQPAVDNLLVDLTR